MLKFLHHHQSNWCQLKLRNKEVSRLELAVLFVFFFSGVETKHIVKIVSNLCYAKFGQIHRRSIVGVEPIDRELWHEIPRTSADRS